MQVRAGRDASGTDKDHAGADEDESVRRSGRPGGQGWRWTASWRQNRSFLATTTHSRGRRGRRQSSTSIDVPLSTLSDESGRRARRTSRPYVCCRCRDRSSRMQLGTGQILYVSCRRLLIYDHAQRRHCTQAATSLRWDAGHPASCCVLRYYILSC